MQKIEDEALAQRILDKVGDPSARSSFARASILSGPGSLVLTLALSLAASLSLSLSLPLVKVNSMNGKMAIISTALSLVYALAPWKQ